MRHNKYIPTRRLVVATLRLPDDGGMIFLPDLGNQRVDAPGDLLGALTALAPVAPDVPVAPQPLGLARVADLGARDPLVVAVVPLADRLRHLDARAAVVCRRRVRGLRAVRVPW